MSKISKHYRNLLIALGLVSFIATLDLTIVYTAIPSIQKNINASVVEVQWVMNAFLISLATSMMIVGRLSDIYGQRRVLYIGIALFALASLLAGLSANIEQLVACRILQGIGIAILYTVPMAIVINTFPQEEQGSAYGLLIGIKGFGMAIGPALGGLLIGFLSWRWVFFINVPIILTGYLILRQYIKGDDVINKPNERVNYMSVLTFTVCVASIIFGLVQLDSWGFFSPQILAVFSIALISGVIFFWQQLHTEHPLIDFSLFKITKFNLGLSVNFILAFSYCIILLLAPLYLGNVLGETAIVLGLMLLPLSCMVAIFSPVIGRFMDQFGSINFVIVGFILFTLSYVLQYNFSAESTKWFVILSYTIFGVGWACILSPSIMTALGAVPTSSAGIASGAVGTFHNVGGAFGLAIITIINNLHEGSEPLTQHLLNTYHQGMIVLVILALLAIIISISAKLIQKA